MTQRIGKRSQSQLAAIALITTALLAGRGNPTFAWAEPQNKPCEGISLLSKLPHISQLFAVSNENCELTTCPTLSAQLDVAPFFAFGVGNSDCGAQSCDPTQQGMCVISVCQSDCESTASRSKCDKSCCAAPELHETILSQQQAIAQLRVQLELSTLKMQMLEQLTEARVENARLEARLEMAEELFTRMTEEIDRLKDQLAESKPRKQKKESSTASKSEGKKRR